MGTVLDVAAGVCLVLSLVGLLGTEVVLETDNRRRPFCDPRILTPLGVVAGVLMVIILAVRLLVLT